MNVFAKGIIGIKRSCERNGKKGSSIVSTTECVNIVKVRVVMFTDNGYSVNIFRDVSKRKRNSEVMDKIFKDFSENVSGFT